MRFHLQVNPTHTSANWIRLVAFSFLLITAAALDKMLGVTSGPLLVNSEHCKCSSYLG